MTAPTPERPPLDVEELKRLAESMGMTWEPFLEKYLNDAPFHALAFVHRAALTELEGLRRDVRALWEREVVSYFTAGDRERECGSVMGTLKWIDESEIPALGAILRARHAEYVAARVAARAAEEESRRG